MDAKGLVTGAQKAVTEAAGDDYARVPETGDAVYDTGSNDIVSGGDGEAVLESGIGSDTFRFTRDSLGGKAPGDKGDVIHGFTISNKESETDVLDLHELVQLSGMDGLTGLELLERGYLSLTTRLDEDGRLVVTLGIDPEGTGAAYEVLATVHMTGDALVGLNFNRLNPIDVLKVLENHNAILF